VKDLEQWEYKVVLVNKWGMAVRPDPRSGSEPWQFDEKKALDLITLLAQMGTERWELVGIDTNVSYAQASYSYVGSLYIFQRAM
jgi:hypothetical protein